MTQSDVQRIVEQALQHHQGGRLHEAEALYRQSLANQPAHADALNLLGVLLHQTGRTDGALPLIDRAIQINPRSAVYYNNRGLVLLSLQRFDEAEAAYRQALSLQPGYADALYSLGWIEQHKEAFADALATYERVIGLRPDYLIAYINAGNVLGQLKRWDDAAAMYRRAIAARPDYADAYSNLGTALKERGKTQEAIAAYQKAIALKPDSPEAYNNLGNALHSLGQARDAVTAYQRSIDLRPDTADSYQNMAAALLELNEFDQAMAASETAIGINPNLAAAHNSLANALKSVGRLDESIEESRRAASLTRESYAQANLMLAITFHPDYTPKQIYEEHARWNDEFAKPLAPSNLKFPNDPASDRRIRVGYVGSHFRDHCQSFFTVPLLSHHDHTRFKIFCYADVARPDAITNRVRSYSDGWRDIAGLTDELIADAVKKDAIDILVDLSLHLEGGHLLAFARKPAPVQVTWLGYPGTTGLTAVDYRLSDPLLDPGFDDQFYSERTIRLPVSFWCFDPLTAEPAVNELPAVRNGYITFGCLNNLTKVTDRTLAIWAKVLRATPGSRLRLLAQEGSARKRPTNLLAAHGVSADRVEFVGRMPRQRYLQEYHQIDICLDPFPCPGHTTSMDSLWMGVPVVNLPGTTAVSRGGASILTQVGLPELVAGDEDHYVRIASELANDFGRLGDLRRTLRTRMESSSLMDAGRFTKDFEAALAMMWETWCKSQSPAPDHVESQ